MSTRQSRAAARRASRDESGSALVLALLVVLVVASGLAAALDYVGTGLTLAPTIRDARNSTNYVQGAVEGAINQVRGSSEAGLTDTSCPTFNPSAPSGLSGVSGKTFSVTCTGLDAGTTYPVDQPRYAIQALGTGAMGIRQVAGNAQLYVDGGIYSKGVVSVGGGAQNSLRVNGTILAEGSCSGRITQTDPRPLSETCSRTTTALGDDPNYGSSIPDATSLASLIGTSPITAGADPLPTCNGNLIEFGAGYYQESPADLVSSFLAKCNASVWHFAPGRYYFDYPSPWVIKGYQVVGGTLSSTPTVIGSACDPSKNGVQFVFGGASQVSVQASSGPGAGSMELCGPPAGHTLNGAPQRIVLYGVKTGAAPTPQPPATLKATTDPSSTPTTTFPLPAAARILDNVSATATFGNEKVARLDYGVLPSPGLPKGARVLSATLRWRHKVTNATAQIELSGIGLASPLSLSSPDDCSSICTRDLTTTDLPKDVLWRSLSGLSAAYVITPAKNKVPTATVDGLEVSVTYTAPTLNTLTCGACSAFFTSTTNPNVFMHGTVYTPTADWDVDIHNSGETIFDRGVILRDIAITMSSSSKQETSPFQLPRGTPNGRLVLFQGYVDGIEKVRACVRYVDQVPLGPSTASYAGWSLTVPRWLVMRTPSAQSATCS